MFNRKLVEIQAFRCDVGHLQVKPKNQSCKAVDPWNQLGENVIVKRDVSFLGADFSIRHPPCLSPAEFSRCNVRLVYISEEQMQRWDKRKAAQGGFS